MEEAEEVAGDWTRRRSQTVFSVLDPGQDRPHGAEAPTAFPGSGHEWEEETVPGESELPEGEKPWGCSLACAERSLWGKTYSVGPLLWDRGRIHRAWRRRRQNRSQSSDVESGRVGPRGHPSCQLRGHTQGHGEI